MLYLIELEPVETRYTAQWQKYLPQQLENAGIPTTVISGPPDTPQDTTPGAFLNFSGTNYWKSEQLKQIAKLFADGTVKDGDYFLYTDAWNPTVIQLKYMADLLNISIKIGGMWHAGSYDPHDFLGRVQDKTVFGYTECAMYSTYDHNFFATQFHCDLFSNTYPLLPKGRMHKVGWPMEYLKTELAPHIAQQRLTEVRANRVLFPHRLAPEKQLDIFELLSNTVPDCEYTVCQSTPLTKAEYHDLLCSSKVVFSANTQETLGISMYEGVLCGCVPMVPDRLSYSEMFPVWCKYPSEWTETYGNAVEHRDKLANDLISKISFHSQLSKRLTNYTKLVQHLDQFFSGEKLYEIIKSGK